MHKGHVVYAHNPESWFHTVNCLLVACLTSQQYASVSQGRISSDNFTCCHTEIELSTSPSHSILIPGRPVPALTLYRQAPGRVATGVPIFKPLIWLDPQKSRRKRDSNPGSSAPEADALTTRPARRSHPVVPEVHPFSLISAIFF